MRCPEAVAAMVAYLDGELDVTEASAVREHVESCASCAGELRELRATSELLLRWDPSDEVQSTIAELRDEISELRARVAGLERAVGRARLREVAERAPSFL